MISFKLFFSTLFDISLHMLSFAPSVAWLPGHFSAGRRHGNLGASQRKEKGSKETPRFETAAFFKKQIMSKSYFPYTKSKTPGQSSVAFQKQEAQKWSIGDHLLLFTLHLSETSKHHNSVDISVHLPIRRPYECPPFIYPHPTHSLHLSS